MINAVAYRRVSTQQQHRSGLGIEAQRAAIARFGEAEGITIIQEFVEAETGAIRRTGATTLEAITKGLNERGIRPARGTRWYASSVANLLNRANKPAEVL
jgi:DNA invertase Pin-like site-specific DNA recombinase